MNGLNRLRKKSERKLNLANVGLAGAEARLILRTLSARDPPTGWVPVDDQDVVPSRQEALARSGLWKSWKAEVRFPLSHNPGCCYEHGFI